MDAADLVSKALLAIHGRPALLVLSRRRPSHAVVTAFASPARVGATVPAVDGIPLSDSPGRPLGASAAWIALLAVSLRGCSRGRGRRRE
jgi:hypothetical protein